MTGGAGSAGAELGTVVVVFVVVVWVVVVSFELGPQAVNRAARPTQAYIFMVYVLGWIFRKPLAGAAAEKKDDDQDRHRYTNQPQQ